MSPRQRLGATLLVALASMWACRGSRGTATSPSSTPTPPPTANPTTTFSLNGKVRNLFTAAPISGATVSIVDGPNAGKATTTDMSGTYSFRDTAVHELFPVKTELIVQFLFHGAAPNERRRLALYRPAHLGKSISAISALSRKRSKMICLPSGVISNARMLAVFARCEIGRDVFVARSNSQKSCADVEMPCV
jgi:hypothetical protein